MIDVQFTSNKKMNYGYIYAIKEKETNKYYIGQHKGQEFDENYWGSGALIKKAIQLLGYEAFERSVLAWCEDQLELDALEAHYIYKYNCLYPNGFNKVVSGQRGRPKIKIKKNFIDLSDNSTSYDIKSIENVSKGLLFKWKQKEKEILTKKIITYESIIEKLLYNTYDKDEERLLISKFELTKSIKVSSNLRSLYDFLKEEFKVENELLWFNYDEI